MSPDDFGPEHRQLIDFIFDATSRGRRPWLGEEDFGLLHDITWKAVDSECVLLGLPVSPRALLGDDSDKYPEDMLREGITESYHTMAREVYPDIGQTYAATMGFIQSIYFSPLVYDADRKKLLLINPHTHSPERDQFSCSVKVMTPEELQLLFANAWMDTGRRLKKLTEEAREVDDDGFTAPLLVNIRKRLDTVASVVGEFCGFDVKSDAARDFLRASRREVLNACGPDAPDSEKTILDLVDRAYVGFRGGDRQPASEEARAITAVADESRRIARAALKSPSLN